MGSVFIHQQVKHSCGHATLDEVPRSTMDMRRSRIAWLETVPCRDCVRLGETQKAAEAAQAAGLPPLSGSPKQVAWAERIRAEAIEGNAEDAARLEQPPTTRDGVAREVLAPAVEAARAAWARLHAETAARWWIDERPSRWYVREAFDACAKDVPEVAARRKEADEARAAAEDAKAAEAAERRRLAAEKEAARQAEERREAQAAKDAAAACVDYVVTSVDSHADGFVARGLDGREAWGFIDGGAWVVTEVGGVVVDTHHPVSERIARDARVLSEGVRA